MLGWGRSGVNGGEGRGVLRVDVLRSDHAAAEQVVECDGHERAGQRRERRIWKLSRMALRQSCQQGGIHLGDVEILQRESPGGIAERAQRGCIA